MRKTSLAAATGLCLVAGCTTDRVTTDFQKLSEVAGQANDSLTPRLAPTLARERQAQITSAARNKDIWFLSDACQAVLRGAAASDATNCSITRVAAAGTSVPPGQGMALQRRMDVIRTYVGALALLTDPSVEKDLVSAAEALVDSLGELGTATGSDDLLAFVERRLAARDDTQTVVTTALSGQRYRKMRSTVLKSEENVADIVREIQVGILNLELEPEFASRSARLRAADARVRNTDADNVSEYRAALAGLESEHASFLSYYENTLLYEVGLISAYHSALANRFRNGASPAEVADYLSALVAVSDAI